MRFLPALRRKPELERSSVTDNPISLAEFESFFTFEGLAYYLSGAQTLQTKTEEIGQDFSGLVRGAYQRSGIVFACEIAKLLPFGEVRLCYQMLDGGRPTKLWGDQTLAILEQPWPNGTTGKLLRKMLLHADFAGNAYVVSVKPGQLKVLRPDWVTVVVGSLSNPDAAAWDPDAELLGYMYHPGGRNSGKKPWSFRPEQVAHFAPIPDPLFEHVGMSWLRPVLNDVRGDQAAMKHKLAFFEHGATPNIIVKGLNIQDPEKWQKWIEMFRDNYEGARNAYKTMILANGADATVVGANFQQIDFKATVGVSETRIAAAARVPAAIVGLSEGLQGSTLNAGNFAAVRRQFADMTIRPLWAEVAAALSTLVPVQQGSRLWYDDRGVPFVQEDRQATAEELQAKTIAIKTLVDAGFQPDVAAQAIDSNDLSLLQGQHTGNISVQLRPIGSNGSTTAIPAATGQ